MARNKFLWGLDISMTCTGVAIYDLEESKFVYIGSFETEKIKSRKNRYHNALKLQEKAKWLLELEKEYPPYFISIERGFSRFNTATQTIFRAHGVVNYIFWDYPQRYYPPKSVKEALIHGNASKEDLAIAIKAKYNYISFKNEDESDAVAVALTTLIEEGIIEWEKPIWSEIKAQREPKEPKKRKKKVDEQ